ncbi:uncharacterized protein LOC107003994 [Solanum pennellii]|uniref:Uncharacterized protein LOC107003994 n=1 Tax=Solanum pennellii TaxID=28526 RepID=A0ABM1FJ88_SOLPN|nr:uncharacterized protein LOC107003994 [Solanum pennellii]
MDVHNAFLNGDLLEEVYMDILVGFLDMGRLTRSSYYTSSYMGLRILVHVDDLLIIGNNQHLLCDTRLDIQKKFKMKDLGELKFFLGIEKSRPRGAKLACTPLELNQKLTSIKYDEHINNGVAEDDNILADPAKYQRLIGRLLYLTMSRPDIAFSVQVLSQFIHCPKQSHINTTLRVVRYIKEAPGLGLLMSAGENTELTTYCDFDWGGCLETRRSVTGYIVKFGGGLISWKSKKQKTVSRSSVEAEFRNMAACAAEITWLNWTIQRTRNQGDSASKTNM